jgi:spore germination protein
MRAHFLPLFLALTLLTPLAAHAATPAPASALEVSGWIPYWRTASGTADMLAHLDSFTEINPFGYTVRTDGTLYDALGILDTPWAALVAAAKAKHIRVIPTVMWANTDAIHQVLSHTASRIKLENDIAKLAKANNFDGIDIDFENKMAEDKDYFSTFLKGLYARMGPKWVMCSIEPRMPLADRYLDPSQAPPDATTYANDYAAINKYCDRVRLMTYDQGTASVVLNAAQSGPYVPVADPKWVADIVNLAAQTIPKKKLELGIATYGYEYALNQANGSYQYSLLWAFDPGYATQIEQQYGVAPVRNSAGELSLLYTPHVAPERPTSADPITYIPSSIVASPSVAQAFTPATQSILWWSDASAVADKVALAKSLGVRGIALFKIDGGEDPNIWNVLPTPYRPK